MADIRFNVVTEVLSDGSKAFNVHMRDSDRRLLFVFHAITETAAHELIADLRSAVHAYTVDVVASAFWDHEAA